MPQIKQKQLAYIKEVKKIEQELFPIVAIRDHVVQSRDGSKLDPDLLLGRPIISFPLLLKF
jgi:hypothetical protein